MQSWILYQEIINNNKKIEMRIKKIFFIIERWKNLIKRKNNLLLAIKSFGLRDFKRDI